MKLQDQQRFEELVGEFLDECDIHPPFHLVTIDAGGSVAVTHHRVGDVQEVCRRTAPGPMHMPITLTVIAPDGAGRSARITTVGAGLRMM